MYNIFLSYFEYNLSFLVPVFFFLFFFFFCKICTGVLTEPTTTFEFGQEYVQATYVRYLEMAGALVVPVR